MKKLLLVLALLILTGQGVFAATVPNKYPACFKGYGTTSANYNGTNGDNADWKGWCVDGFGVLTPKNTTVDSTNPNSQGGIAVPVLVVTNTPGNSGVTFDALLPQQTGSMILDTGGYAATVVTMDTLVGNGGHYVLPPAMPGELFTISSASKSTITVDTLNTALALVQGLTYPTADTIEWSPGGTAMTAGQNLKSPGFAGDSISLYSPATGMWMITSMQGGSNTATQDSIWTVVNTP